MSPVLFPEGPWPALPYDAWRETCETLHRWSQIVGKTRLSLEPLVNHWWQVALYLSARGLTTSAMPYGDAGLVEIEFDFIAHQLVFRTSEGARQAMPLVARSVADFYAEYRQVLSTLGIGAKIWPVPSELPDTLPFAEDHVHASYDPEMAQRFWRVLILVDRVFKSFRGRYVGKSSPVHLFWGGLDLAVSRFSGRPAPPHPGGIPNVADWVMREGYSHEVSSAGFWPGSEALPEPAFYAYVYPTPPGFGDAPVRPEAAYFHQGMGEFLLPYETVRVAPSPGAAILDFLQSTYEAAAGSAGWDRKALERGSR
ncbi:MAG: hypothetical protein JF614_21090 [Acidobacteria bacterium]|nr:hypothetical protein [Acidobacteriota bacterium]